MVLPFTIVTGIGSLHKGSYHFLSDKVQGPGCQIGIEISDYIGDKISVGVARPSHVGQSVPCDG